MCIFSQPCRIINFRCFDGLSEGLSTTNKNAIPTVDGVSTSSPSSEQICKPLSASNVRIGESSAEQYWERFVLGIDKAKLITTTTVLNRYGGM